MSLTPLDDGEQKALSLAAAIRNGRREEALRLLHEGASVDVRDSGGSYPLHYAAGKGYDDVIELLLEKQADVNSRDMTKKTALHHAAEHGHALVLVVLVAGGADVNARDNHPKVPLEYAVENKKVDVVKLLCLFGAEPKLFDWSWVKDPNIQSKKDEYEMARILKRHVEQIWGYKYKEILFDVRKISEEEGSTIRLSTTDIQVNVAKGQEHSYLYICQKEDTNGSPSPMDTDMKVFGPLLECQLWSSETSESICLKVTVVQPVLKNEEVIVWSGKELCSADKVEVQEENGVESTVVTITVPLQSTGVTHFEMRTKPKKEVFPISKEAMLLKPQSEPGTEIDIPADTFDSGELEIKIYDSKEAIKEHEEDEVTSVNDPVVISNFIGLSTSNGKQPKKEIEMKIPVSAKYRSVGVLVLVTSNPDPNLERWHWDRIPAEIDGNDKAVFKISHFSDVVVIPKPKDDASLASIENEVQIIRQKKRKVYFLVAVRPIENIENRIEMVIACGTQNKIKSLKTSYNNDFWCFTPEQPIPGLFIDGQSFQVKINGSDEMNLIFKGTGKIRKRTIEIVMEDRSGQVDIIKKMDKPAVEKVDNGCFFLGFFRRLKTTRVPKMETVKLGTILFRFIEPKGEVSGLDNRQLSPNWDILKRIAELHLSPDEARQLYFHLGLRDHLMMNTNENLVKTVIMVWLQGKAPTADMKRKFQDALRAIGRKDLIDLALEKPNSISNQERV